MDADTPITFDSFRSEMSTDQETWSQKRSLVLLEGEFILVCRHWVLIEGVLRGATSRMGLNLEGSVSKGFMQIHDNIDQKLFAYDAARRFATSVLSESDISLCEYQILNERAPLEAYHTTWKDGVQMVMCALVGRETRSGEVTPIWLPEEAIRHIGTQLFSGRILGWAIPSVR